MLAAVEKHNYDSHRYEPTGAYDWACGECVLDEWVGVSAVYINEARVTLADFLKGVHDDDS